MNVIVFGAAGRMGKELVQLCQTDDIKLIAAIDRQGNGTHRSLSEVTTSEKGVLVDFSSPEGLREAADWCVKNNWALVSGTTGIGAEEEDLLNQAAEKIPVLWASNMSMGVAVLRRLIHALHALKDDFDFQIEDFHHRYKKDAPSGTAKTLQADLENAVGKKVPPVVSIRGGGIFGIHSIWAMSDEEIIKLEHQALNRAVFAKGALRAARFLSGKTKGRYNFDEVLG